MSKRPLVSKALSVALVYRHSADHALFGGGAIVGQFDRLAPDIPNFFKHKPLEGLYLLLGDGSGIPLLPSVFRSNVSGQPNQPTPDDFPTFWQSLFYDKQGTVPANILAQTDSGDTMRCQLSAPTNHAIQMQHDWIKEEGTPKQEFRVVISGDHPARPQQQPFRIGHDMGGRPGHNPFASEFIVLSTRLEHPTREADLFNQVSLLEGGEERLLSLLREIDPRLQKLRYLKAPGTSQPLVYAHFGLKNALSMTQTGQGFSKLFSLFCQMLISKAKVLLIDEIENGLYYESLPVIWKGIGVLAASQDIQVFATTHSRECIVAAHGTFSATPDYNFGLHRLQRAKNRIEAITHDRQMLDVAIKSGMEVR